MASVSASKFQLFEYDTAIKVLADSSDLKAVPSKFNFVNEPTALSSDSLPIVDFSALTADDPDQRSRAIRGLGRACEEWGFFILVNHGVLEAVMNAMFTATKEFFNLPETEKKQYEAKSASDPIICGNLNVRNTSNQTITLWRDILKLNVHPEFHCPLKPPVLREVVLEYSQRTRGLARKLVEAISEYLELEHNSVDEILKLDSSFQLFVTNLYPPCPQPDQAIGIPPHTDPGLFTFLIHNGVAGLQIEHDGKWFNVDSPQNSIFVNVADHLQIFTNGRFKSVMHRAVVNKERDRISIVVTNGPSEEAAVGPAASLVEKDGRALYHTMKYKKYMEELIVKFRVNGKPILEEQMIQQDEQIVS